MKGLHALVMNHVARGVRVLLAGTVGQVRAADDGISASVDTQLVKHSMDLFVPSNEFPPYKFARKSIMILGQGQITYQVCCPADVGLQWFHSGGGCRLLRVVARGAVLC